VDSIRVSREELASLLSFYAVMQGHIYQMGQWLPMIVGIRAERIARWKALNPLRGNAWPESAEVETTFHPAELAILARRGMEANVTLDRFPPALLTLWTQA
jgi:hypothetical protein